MSPTVVEPAATREQILAAAAAVFAEAGFRAATVRDICQRAGANVAAVNYHFGGKQPLYTEVLRRNYQRALQRFPPEDGVPASAPARERLHGFIRSFLRRIFSEGLDSCDGRLLAREMVDPTPALDALVATEVRDLVDRLAGILRQLLPARTDERSLRFCLGSVLSQIVFYHHCRPVIRRMFPDLEFDQAAGLEALAEHITRFSLAGVRAAALPLATPSPVPELTQVPTTTLAAVPTVPRRTSTSRSGRDVSNRTKRADRRPDGNTGTRRTAPPTHPPLSP